jgi:hypothetical protein
MGGLEIAAFPLTKITPEWCAEGGRYLPLSCRKIKTGESPLSPGNLGERKSQKLIVKVEWVMG